MGVVVVAHAYKGRVINHKGVGLWRYTATRCAHASFRLNCVSMDRRSWTISYLRHHEAAGGHLIHILPHPRLSFSLLPASSSQPPHPHPTTLHTRPPPTSAMAMFTAAARSSTPTNPSPQLLPAPPLRPMPVSSSHLSRGSLQSLLVENSSEAATNEDGYATDDTGECYNKRGRRSWER
jgi:hypothetical protein